MSTNAIRDMQNATTVDQIQKANANRGSERSANDIMGRHDFLMLLSAQLRHQDPLNPQSDADFAAQLAQFSSLEQMMNMSEALTSMQAFNLVGQYVIADTMVDGRLQTVAGIVDSVFTEDGTKFAQIGDIAVAVSDINEVFDGSIFGLPDQLIQTSNNLLGRTVKASTGKEDEDDIEGIVVGVKMDDGRMQAQIDVGGEIKTVPIGNIFEIRNTPLETQNEASLGERTELIISGVPQERLVPYNDGIMQLTEDNEPYIFWEWDYTEGRWVGAPVAAVAPSRYENPSYPPADASAYSTAGNSYSQYGGSYEDSGQNNYLA